MVGDDDKLLQHSDLAPPHSCCAVEILESLRGLFSAEIGSFWVKLLPYLDLINLVFVCYLSVYVSSGLTHAVCEMVALPCHDMQ